MSRGRAAITAFAPLPQTADLPNPYIQKNTWDSGVRSHPSRSSRCPYLRGSGALTVRRRSSRRGAEAPDAPIVASWTSPAHSQAPLVQRPPATITFKGRTIDLETEDNPYRELETSDPAAFSAHVNNGRRVYIQNCIYCHGDDMEGDGLFAHGFDPIPANFQDATTIAMLQESYLFWRISKGAPGLPAASTPWSSSMPAWENFLSEEEIWDVILFLYEFTDQRPRAKEVHE